MRRASGLIGFALGAIYIPDVTGTALQPGWALILVVLAVALMWRRAAGHPPLALSGAHYAGLAFLAIAAATLLWSPFPLDGIGALVPLAAFALTVWWSGTLGDVRSVLIGLALGLLPSDLLAVDQLFHLVNVPVFQSTPPPAGFFVSKNSFGEASALIMVALLANRVWWGAPLALPGALLTSCRAAWLALAVATIAALWPRARAAALFAVVLAVVLLMAGLATGYKLESALERITIWRDTVSAIVPWGHGIGSFPGLYPAYGEGMDAAGFRPQHAYNEFLEIAFETGFGLIPATLFIAFCLEVPFGPWHPVLLAFCAIAIVDAPLHLPLTAALGALAAGRLARRMRDHGMLRACSRSALSLRA